MEIMAGGGPQQTTIGRSVFAGRRRLATSGAAYSPPDAHTIAFAAAVSPRTEVAKAIVGPVLWATTSHHTTNSTAGHRSGAAPSPTKLAPSEASDDHPRRLGNRGQPPNSDHTANRVPEHIKNSHRRIGLNHLSRMGFLNQ
jgi:hypothetical protein